MLSDRFDKEFGVSINPLKENEFIIYLSKNNHVAFVDIEKMAEEMEHPEEEWFDFVLMPPADEDCYIHYSHNYYDYTYIKKGVEVIAPDKYNFIKAEFKPTAEMDYLLILKKDNQGVLIAPTINRRNENEIDFFQIVKKTASSVFVV